MFVPPNKKRNTWIKLSISTTKLRRNEWNKNKPLIKIIDVHSITEYRSTSLHSYEVRLMLLGHEEKQFKIKSEYVLLFRF